MLIYALEIFLLIKTAGQRISKEEYMKSKQKVEEKPKVLPEWS